MTTTKTKKAAKSKGKPVVVAGKTYHLIEGSERKGVLLIEQFNFEFSNNDKRIIAENDQTLEEKKAVKAKGGIICEGKIGHVDKPTANGRIYTRQIMEREIKKILDKNRTYGYALGEVDHPGDGKSRIKHVGHVIHDMRVESNGDIWGRYHILPTTHGQDVITIVEAGGAVGSSSRGIGTTTTTEEGFDLVGEDFRLATFDLVSDPAASGAYPKFFAEDSESGQAIAVKPETVTVEHLEHEFPELVKHIRTKAHEEACDTIEIVQEAPICDRETLIAEERDRLRDEIREEALAEARASLREEFSLKVISLIKENEKALAESAAADRASDPMEASAQEKLRRIQSLVGAKPVEESSGSRDAVIAELRSQANELAEGKKALEDKNVKLEALMVHVAKKSYVNETLALRDDGDEIREALGDLDSYEQVEDLQSKLRSLIDEAEERELDLQEAREDGAKEADGKSARRIQELERQLKEQRLREAHSKDAVKGEVSNILGQLTDRLERLELSRQEDREALKKSEAANARLRREKKALSEQAEAKSSDMKKTQEDMKRKNIRHQLENYARRRGRGHRAMDEAVSQVRNGEITSKEGIDRFFSGREDATSLDEQVTRSLRQGRGYDHSGAGRSRTSSQSQGGERFSDDGDDSGEFFNEHAEMLNLNPSDFCGSAEFL